MKRILIFVGLLSFSLLGTTPAVADIIFDNGETDSLAGLRSDGTEELAADNFVLEAGSTTITSIRWWGFYEQVAAPAKGIVSPNDDFTIYIFGDDSGTPGDTPLHTFSNSVSVASNGTNNGGRLEFEYVMDITPLELTAGTTYWLAIENPIFLDLDKGSPAIIYWNWSTSAQVGDAHSKIASAWIDRDAELAFQLEGAVVPEPATVVLIGMGLAGLALRARRTRG